MKYKFLIVVSLLWVAAFSYGQTRGKWVTESFWVNHDCDMCKDRILTAIDLQGIRKADYDMESYTLTVTYRPDRISIEQIHQKVADTGYDTSLIRASEESYARLPDCCQYDRKRRPEEQH